MTEPINLQLNIMQGQDMARVNQQQKDVGTHQMISQEMNRAKDSDEKPHQVEESDKPESSQLNKDGSGRGRAFQRRHGGAEGEAEESEDERPVEPDKGLKVDTLR